MTNQKHFVKGAMLALLFALLSSLCCPPALAADSNADLRELQRYTLTLADVRKYAAANETLAKLPKPAPKEEEEENDDEDSNDESLDDMVKRMEAVPGARKAIEGAGLTVRQYLVSTYGVDESRLQAKGFGPSKPSTGNDTPEGRQQNRRVELVRI